MPKRVRLRRMRVSWREPNRFERGPLGEPYAQIRWSAQLDEREDGTPVVRLIARTHPTRGDVLQAVICLVIRQWPHASISDIADMANCSREVAWRRKQVGLQLNAAYDAKWAALRAASGSVSQRRQS